MELQQQFDKQNIMLCRGSLSKNDGDRVRRMKNVLCGKVSPEEALLKACFSPVVETPTHDGRNPSDSVISHREDELQLVRIEYKKSLQHQERLRKQLDPLPSNTEHRSCSRDAEDCDPEGTEELEKLLEEARRDCRFDHQNEFDRDEPSKEERDKKEVESKKRQVAAEKAIKKDGETAKASTETTKASVKKLERTGSALNASMNVSDRVQNFSSEDQEIDGSTDTDKTTEEPSTYNDKEIVSSLKPLDPGLWKTKLEKRDAITYSLKTIARHVWKLRTEFLSRWRALRFLKTGQEFHMWQCQNGPRPTCVKCGEAAENPSNIFVLGVCGHAACKNCLEEKHFVKCVLDGCSSVVCPQNIHAADILGSAEQCGSFYGAKVDSIVSLIKGVAKDDQVLLFIQFQSVLNVVCPALKASGISYYVVRDGKTQGAESKICDFQENKNEGKKQVLILNPSNETAAGL